MIKRVTLILGAAAAGPLALAAQPAVVKAAECVFASVSDNSYSGSSLVTTTAEGSTVGARIESSFGRLRFITEGSTLHYMKGYVNCSEIGGFDNPWWQWTQQDTAGSEININCPSGYEGLVAVANLMKYMESCPPGGPGPD